jgi:vacuolar iron transporter family protein
MTTYYLQRYTIQALPARELMRCHLQGIGRGWWRQSIRHLGLFGIVAGVSLTAGSPLWKAGARQILLGLLAAGITFGLGRLIGSAVG